MQKRIDSFFHQPYFKALEEHLAQCESILELRQAAAGLTNGDHGGLDYTPTGIRYLRGQSVGEDGLDLRDELYISEIEHERMQRSEVVPGDVLFTIAGSIGNACVVAGIEKANINQAIVRVKTGKGILPQFLADFLNSKYGKFQSNRLANGGVQLNINFSEVGQIKISAPAVTKQRELVAALDIARTSRRAKLAEADALLSSLDGYLLDLLGLAPPPADTRRAYAIRLDAVNTSRFDPDYFHPERILSVRGMQQADGRLRCAPLQSIVDFRRDQLATPAQNYLSLAHVQSHTGELIPADDSAAGACFMFAQDDVLFGRLRPYLNKVHRAEGDGCCSPEFHVMRVRPGSDLLPDYLAAVLRSSLILSQTRHMMTGNTHPRLANEDVVNLVIPIPDIETQTIIANEVSRRREYARALRIETEAEWARAKQWFEEQLLGPVP